MASLSAPYATCNISADEAYGPISRSSPDWKLSNFCDRGKAHINGCTAVLASTGFEQWYSNDQQQGCTHRPLARAAATVPQSSCYAEPVVQGAHSTYYARRPLDAAQPDGFRTSKRMVQPVVHVDRPTGKKAIPEPNGPPPKLFTCRAASVQPNTSPDVMPEPNIPRLGRPGGVYTNCGSDQELTFERAVGRRVRVGVDTYRGTGRAGDMSYTFSPQKRPEDDRTFFTKPVDSLTFRRFVAACPAKVAVGPHQRRNEEMQRLQKAELCAEQQLVAALTLPVEDDA